MKYKCTNCGLVWDCGENCENLDKDKPYFEEYWAVLPNNNVSHFCRDVDAEKEREEKENENPNLMCYFAGPISLPIYEWHLAERTE